MKNRIYITGIAATLVVFLGVSFKVQHWPGASILLFTGMLLLLFVFLPIALRSNYRAEGGSTGLLLYIVTWITCLVVFGSMLFKLLHWPGAGWLLMFAIPFPYVVFLPVYLAVTGKNPNHNIYNTVAILFLLALISAQSAMLSLSVSKDRIVDSLHLSETYERASKALADLPPDGSRSELNSAIDEATDLINQYEERIFRHEGITSEQFSADPGILTDLSRRKTAVHKLNGTEKELLERIEGKLREVGNLLRMSPGNTLSDEEIDLLLMPIPDTGEIYGWSSSKISFPLQPWMHVWLDGVRTRMEMMKE